VKSWSRRTVDAVERGALDDRELGLHLLAAGLAWQPLRAEDRAQHVVEVVRHARRHLAERAQLLRAHEPVLRLVELDVRVLQPREQLGVLERDADVVADGLEQANLVEREPARPVRRREHRDLHGDGERDRHQHHAGHALGDQSALGQPGNERQVGEVLRAVRLQRVRIDAVLEAPLEPVAVVRQVRARVEHDRAGNPAALVIEA
jgi:hypothetical protein